jgi:hypothetical protein
VVADGWTGLLLFLLLAAPGLLFDLRARSWRVTTQESAFEEVGRITLASLGFTAFGALVAWGAWHLPLLRFDYLRFSSDSAYAWANAFRALGVLAISTVAACLLAVVVDGIWKRRRTRDGSVATLSGSTEWYDTFRTDRPAGTMCFAQVDLVDGTSWRGWIERYSADAREGARAIVLSGHLSVTRPGSAPLNLDRAWSRVVIEGSQIATVAVKYLERPNDVPAPGPQGSSIARPAAGPRP